MFKAITDFFKNIFFPKLIAFLKSVFTNAVQTAIQDIQDTVQKVVAELQTSDLTSDQKREEAYARVVAILKSQGKTISESIIRSTIELAVLALKNTTATIGNQGIVTTGTTK